MGARLMHLCRLPDWESRLMAAIEATPAFSWGTADCCRFAGRIVRAITGADPMEPAYGRPGEGYADGDAAQALLIERGGLLPMVSAVLGAPLASVAQARRGDVVLARLPGCETLGILADARIAAQGADGVVFLPLRRGLAAWRVG